MNDIQAPPRRIRATDIAAVREATSIAAVIGERVMLSPTGGVFAPPGGHLKGLCPFHNEATPSLMLDPARGTWFCFGCGNGGDAFSFVMDAERLSFAEAVERLAAKAEVVVEYEPLPAGPRRA